MDDGVFHQGLDGEHRDHHPLPAGLAVDLVGEFRPHALALDGQILLRAQQLLRQGAHRVLGPVGPAEQVGQIADETGGLSSVLPVGGAHQQIQGVEQEVGADLGLEKFKFHGVELALQLQLFFHLLGVLHPGVQLRLAHRQIGGEDPQQLDPCVQLLLGEHPQLRRGPLQAGVVQAQLGAAVLQTAVKFRLGVLGEKLAVGEINGPLLLHRHRHGDDAHPHVTALHHHAVAGTQTHGVVAGPAPGRPLRAVHHAAAELGKALQPERSVPAARLVNKGDGLPRNVGKGQIHLTQQVIQRPAVLVRRHRPASLPSVYGLDLLYCPRRSKSTHYHVKGPEAAASGPRFIGSAIRNRPGPYRRR